MSTPGVGSILGSSIIYGKVDYGPSIGLVYRPLNQKRVFTAAGNDIIQPYDVFVFYAKTVGAAFSVQLPDCEAWMLQSFGGFDLTCKDAKGDSDVNPITFKPFGSAQTINGLNAAALAASGNGWQLSSAFGAIIFSPLADRSGWVTL